MNDCDKRLNARGWVSLGFALLFSGVSLVLHASSAPPQVLQELIASSCLDCHDENTETRLDFNLTEFQLEDTEYFRLWERVYDQVASGAMPPKKK